MTYQMFFDDSEFSMSVKAQKALDFYFQKFGTPPQVLETSIQDEPVPEGLDLVVRVQRVSIPKFHFLIGIEGVK